MPDVVKHAWTHRPRAQGGTDPIESDSVVPVGMMNGFESSIATGSKLYFPMNTFYTNDSTVYGYADVTSSKAKFMTISAPGVYRAAGYIGWTNASADFVVGDNPHFVFSTQNVAFGTDGDLIPGLNEYHSTDSSAIDAIWNVQREAAGVDYHSLGGEVIFNFSEANYGETPLHIGVALYSDNSRTKAFFASLAVFRVSTELVAQVTIT